MTKALISSILVVLGLVASFLGSLVFFRDEPRLGNANVGAFALQVESNCSSATTTAISTSTLQYLSPGNGTTTVTCLTKGTNQLDLAMFMLASSTLTDLRWRVEYGYATSTNATLTSDTPFYPEAQALVTSAANGTTTLITPLAKEYRWVFASTTSHRIGTSTSVSATFQQNDTGAKLFSLKDIDAQWTRIEFYIPFGCACSTGLGTTAIGDTPGATSTNAGIHIQGIKKEPL